MSAIAEVLRKQLEAVIDKDTIDLVKTGLQAMVDSKTQLDFLTQSKGEQMEAIETLREQVSELTREVKRLNDLFDAPPAADKKADSKKVVTEVIEKE